MQRPPSRETYPQIRPAGVDGILVRFAGTLSEAANRAALAFRAEIDRAGWPGVEESTTALVSAYLRFDPRHATFADIRARVDRLLASRDWMQADLPDGRRLVHIPTAFGGTLAPQLGEAAEQAGLSEAEAIASLTSAPLRVQTLGFAPGQPYLGILPEAWDIPRQTGLTPRVPNGALVAAIRQLVLFSVSAPTGWRHVGQTAAPLFREDRAEPFLLRPGDEVLFHAVTPEAFADIAASGDGGVRAEPLR